MRGFSKNYIVIPENPRAENSGAIRCKKIYDSEAGAEEFAAHSVQLHTQFFSVRMSKCFSAEVKVKKGRIEKKML